MTEFIGQILEAVHKAIDRYGSKFFIAGLAGLALYQLGMADKIDGVYAGIGIILLAFGFFVLRYLQKGDKSENGKKPTE